MAGSSKNTSDIRHVLTGEAFTNFEDVALVKVFHPIYISMAIFGLNWRGNKKMFSGKLCTFDWMTVHCCLVLLAAWFSVLQQFFAYEQSDTYGIKLFRKIFLHLINLQNACGITTNVYYKHKHIQPFVMLWENYKIKYGGVPFAKLRRNILMRLIPINVITMVSSIAFTTIILLINPLILQIYHLHFLVTRGIYVPVWLIVLFSMGYTYINLAWVQSFLFCLCLNKNLSEEFRQLSVQFSEDMHGLRRVPSRLRSTLSQNKVVTTVCENKKQIEHYRQRHLELCKLVTAYDDVISSYLLSIYLFSIPVIILLAYALFAFTSDKSEESVILFLIPFTTLIVIICFVVSITASSSSINSAVSRNIHKHLKILAQRAHNIRSGNRSISTTTCII